jgi:hypothetical protein
LYLGCANWLEGKNDRKWVAGNEKGISKLNTFQGIVPWFTPFYFLFCFSCHCLMFFELAVWSLQRMRKHKFFKRRYSPAMASNEKVRRQLSACLVLRPCLQKNIVVMCLVTV